MESSTQELAACGENAEITAELSIAQFAQLRWANFCGEECLIDGAGRISICLTLVVAHLTK